MGVVDVATYVDVECAASGPRPGDAGLPRLGGLDVRVPYRGAGGLAEVDIQGGPW